MNPPRILLVALAAATLPGTSPAQTFAPFNTRVACQTIAPGYQFEAPGKDKLVETTDRIHELGSDAIKVEMSSRVTTRYGVSLSGVSTLAQMLNLPSFQHLFTKGFQTFVVWAYPLTVSDSFWLNGVTAGEQTAHYNEIYDLVVAMRNSPALAGTTVMLGHWEGDNWLGTSSGADPGATAINGMKDYYRLRQNAVNAARAATPSSTVAVYHYAEVNAVLQTQWNPGWVTVSHNVLDDPTVQVDLISYSCWEASTVQPFNASYLTWSLSDIESHAHFTSAFPGAKKVYLGEFGFPRVWDATTFSTEIEQRDQCRAVIKTAVGWGVPFTFYWQLYNNETTPLQRGFWLIDDTNVKQLVWHDHHDFLGKANTFKNQYRYWLARNPDNSAFGSFAGGYDTFNASNQLNTILDSAEHASLKTNAQYLSLLFSDLLNAANAPADPDYAGYLAQLAGGTPRSVVLNNMLNSPRFEALVEDTEFARHLYLKTLGRATVDEGGAEFQATLTQLGSTARSAVWRAFLNSPEYHAKELDLRAIQNATDPAVTGKQFFDLTFPSRVEEWRRHE